MSKTDGCIEGLIGGKCEMIEVGCQVRIKKGVCGEGYQFVVSEMLPGHFGETQVYGHNFGPQRLTEVELVLTAEQYTQRYGRAS